MAALPNRHEIAPVSGDKVSIVSPRRSPGSKRPVRAVRQSPARKLIEFFRVPLSPATAARSHRGLHTGDVLHPGGGPHPRKPPAMDAHEKVRPLRALLHPLPVLTPPLARSTAPRSSSAVTGEAQRRASGQETPTELIFRTLCSAPHPSEAKIHLRVQMYGPSKPGAPVLTNAPP